jgi:ribosomal protein L32
MVVPRKRTSHIRRNLWRAYDRLTPKNIVPFCWVGGAHKLSHHLCGTCSHCRDHLVLNPKEANATNLGAKPKMLYICDFNLREE